MRRAAALLVAASLGGLFDQPDPGVEAANRAYAKGEYDKALRGYEDAQLRLPQDPRLAYDRGNALYKLGRRDEARAAYQTALGAREGSLETQDWFNLGNALWDLGKKDEAAQAYQRALLLDPSFDDARHNLELLLQPPPPQDGGSPDAGGDGGQGDGGGKSNSPDGGQGDAGGGDGGSSDGGGQGQSRQQGGEDGGPQDAGEQQQPPQGQDGGAQPQPMAQRDGGAGDEHNPKEANAQPLDEQQSQQLLDALRQREKNFQLWKFRLKHQRTQDVEKDW
ncbi:MAG: tetratricopeptide repeat protein [Myxococcales bacterium]